MNDLIDNLTPIDNTFLPFIKKEISIFNKKNYNIDSTDFSGFSFYKNKDENVVVEIASCGGVVRRVLYEFIDGSVFKEVMSIEKNHYEEDCDWQLFLKPKFI